MKRLSIFNIDFLSLLISINSHGEFLGYLKVNGVHVLAPFSLVLVLFLYESHLAVAQWMLKEKEGKGKNKWKQSAINSI